MVSNVTFCYTCVLAHVFSDWNYGVGSCNSLLSCQMRPDCNQCTVGTGCGFCSGPSGSFCGVAEPNGTAPLRGTCDGRWSHSLTTVRGVWGVATSLSQARKPVHSEACAFVRVCVHLLLSCCYRPGAFQVLETSAPCMGMTVAPVPATTPPFSWTRVLSLALRSVAGA